MTGHSQILQHEFPRNKGVLLHNDTFFIIAKKDYHISYNIQMLFKFPNFPKIDLYFFPLIQDPIKIHMLYLVAISFGSLII